MKCTLCGYTKTCTHPSTTLKWTTDCNYQYTCDTCGVVVSSGTIHTYTYGNWDYYTSTYHRRTKSCQYGDMTTAYETESHSTAVRYTEYSTTQHAIENYCATCDSVVGTVNYASHSFEYGEWSSSTAKQHRRSKTCSVCGYMTFEYAYHELTYGDWVKYSSTQHQRTKKCDCGYSGYEYASHSLSSGSWTNYSSTQHYRINSCVCSYSTEEYEDHAFTYGNWKSYSDAKHRRLKQCDCGYSTYVYEAHADSNSDGYCDSCSYVLTLFSVTIPASLEMTVDPYGNVYTAEDTVIINNSTADVYVSELILETCNNWQIVPYQQNMAEEKVDSMYIGFWINGAETQDYGDYAYMDLSWYPEAWIVPQDDILELYYHAVVSASSREIYEQVLTAIFIVDWL